MFVSTTIVVDTTIVGGGTNVRFDDKLPNANEHLFRRRSEQTFVSPAEHGFDGITIVATGTS